jgi:predicted esterase
MEITRLDRGTDRGRRILSMKALFAVTALSLACWPAVASADGAKAKVRLEDREEGAWCAPGVDGIEALPNDVCYLDGGNREARRTLVIFLHGAIAKSSNWSWKHERMMLRVAKAMKIEILFPKSPLEEVGYVWPGTAESQQQKEGALIDQWMTAKNVLEKRGGRPFEDVFVMGFSSGAYFASSLAMRGRLDVDGYAVFAGGQPMPAPRAPEVRRAPVFVGVCANDTTTAAHSRAFAGSLAAAGIPRMVLEQNVGHDLSDVHLVSALGFLRRMNREDRGSI